MPMTRPVHILCLRDLDWNCLAPKFWPSQKLEEQDQPHPGPLQEHPSCHPLPPLRHPVHFAMLPDLCHRCDLRRG